MSLKEKERLIGSGAANYLLLNATPLYHCTSNQCLRFWIKDGHLQCTFGPGDNQTFITIKILKKNLIKNCECDSYYDCIFLVSSFTNSPFPSQGISFLYWKCFRFLSHAHWWLRIASCNIVSRVWAPPCPSCVYVCYLFLMAAQNPQMRRSF